MRGDIAVEFVASRRHVLPYGETQGRERHVPPSSAVRKLILAAVMTIDLVLKESMRLR